MNVFSLAKITLKIDIDFVKKLIFLSHLCTGR